MRRAGQRLLGRLHHRAKRPSPSGSGGGAARATISGIRRYYWLADPIRRLRIHLVDVVIAGEFFGRGRNRAIFGEGGREAILKVMSTQPAVFLGFWFCWFRAA
jgi:hypothetical protein